MKTKTVDFLGVRGEGPTVAAATADAKRKIEDHFRTESDPIVYTIERFCLILSRSVEWGWNYQIVDTGAEPEGKLRRRFSTCGSYDHAWEATRAALLNVAQRLWKRSHGVVVPGWLEGEAERTEFRSWAAWQVAYCQLLDEGKTKDEAWDQAWVRRADVLKDARLVSA